MTINRNHLELFEEAKKENKAAINELEMLASNPSANRDAFTTFGTCYYYGYAVPQDYKKAFAIYEQGAKLGCDVAMYGLGHMFQYGLGRTANLQRAAYWYYEAAKNITPKTSDVNKSIYQLEQLAKSTSPHPVVLTNLGVCYESGYGTPQNYAKAVEMYSQAALQDYDLAMYNLGLAYQHGRGVEKDLSIAMYWYSESIKRITDENRNINQSKKQLDELTKLMQKDTPAKMSIYDAQVVIDFRNDGTFFSKTALTRSNKWNDKNHNLCHLMRGEDLLQKTNQFDTSENSNKLRIYISGHCWVGFDDLYFEGHKKKVHFNELADALAHYIGEQKAVISLMACCAGKGFKKNAADSFGAKLHLALVSKLKRDVPVIARTSLTVAWLNTNQQVTFNLGELEKYKQNYDSSILSLAIVQDTINPKYYIHRQKDSKVVFMMGNNKQIRVDAYDGIQIMKEEWKSNVLATLRSEVNKGTLVKSKEKLLQEWLTKFDPKSADDIYRIMKEELTKIASPLKEHSSGFSKFFNICSATEKSIKRLVNTSASMFDYSQTPTHS